MLSGLVRVLRTYGTYLTLPYLTLHRYLKSQFNIYYHHSIKSTSFPGFVPFIREDAANNYLNSSLENTAIASGIIQIAEIARESSFPLADGRGRRRHEPQITYLLQLTAEGITHVYSACLIRPCRKGAKKICNSDPAIIPQSRIGFPKRGQCTPYLLTIRDSQRCIPHCFCRLPACLLPYGGVNKQTDAVSS